MTIEPLRNWICDGCGEVIQSPADGYVEWLQDNDHKASGWRIVHHAPKSPRHPDGDCYAYTQQPGRCDIDLARFLGDVGLVKLLADIDVGPMHEPTFKGPHVKDLREWTEVVRRVQLPYYEEARRYWEKAQQDGFFESGNEIWSYLPDTLQKLTQKYSK